MTDNETITNNIWTQGGEYIFDINFRHQFQSQQSDVVNIALSGEVSLIENLNYLALSKKANVEN
jgi:hypothetical protein